MTLAALVLAAILLAPVGPLPVDHVSQQGPGADGWALDCSCAVAVMLLRAYTGEVVTVDQCCAEVGCPIALDGYLRVWLVAHGVPTVTSTSTNRGYEEWLVEHRYPFVTIQQFGRDYPVYHAVLVVGFDAAGDVWLHNPSGYAGPELWLSWNYDATRWRNADGAAWVMYSPYPLPEVVAAPVVEAVPVPSAQPAPVVSVRGSWRLIDPRILARLR